jgi:hypothetical protein
LLLPSASLLSGNGSAHFTETAGERETFRVDLLAEFDLPPIAAIDEIEKFV